MSADPVVSWTGTKSHAFSLLKIAESKVHFIIQKFVFYGVQLRVHVVENGSAPTADHGDKFGV